MMKYVLALDQGTTSSRALLFNEDGQILSSAQREFTQIYPMEGWVEHKPWEIWTSQIAVAREALEEGGIALLDLAAIGITNQRETTILWDRKTGEPLYNAIVWQCRRSAPYCEELKKKGLTDFLRERTGLVPDAYFSATKILWLFDHIPGLRERAKAGEIVFGTVDSWILWNLTRGEVHATDVSNASRTMLFNLDMLAWDKEILELLNIPQEILPEVRDCSGFFGLTHPEIFGGAQIPITGIAGDQQAALFGQLCFDQGMTKNTYGTGCFMLMNTGAKPVIKNSGLLATVGWKIGDEICYALEGSIFNAGAAVQWLRDELGFIEDAPSSEHYAMMAGESGVVVVPAFTGLGAPYWDMYARGGIFGLTRGSRKEHLIKATLESIAFQSRDVLHLMQKDSGIELKGLMVDGGASANNFLMQFQADLLQKPIYRPKNLESTALGVCYLAGLGVGLWKDREKLKGLKIEDRVFLPQKDCQWVEKKVDLWDRAVQRCLGWEEK
ncbi:MAG: glycerol kinase GlpK [Tissierellia bacterium]|nr:glycerol kinase GlpK [Tissierellia bacterium]